jgi:hypothetical protein
MSPIAPRPRRPIGYLAALVVVAVLVGPAAGASAAHSKSTATTLVKTSTECNATQLSYGVTGTLSGVAHATAFSMSITNTSSRTCELHGYPTVRFYTSAGRLLTFGYVHTNVMFRRTTPRVVRLAPNDNAYFEVAHALCSTGVRDAASLYYVLAPYTSGEPWVGHVHSPSTRVPPVDYCMGSSHQYLAISPLVASLSDLSLSK